MNEKTVLNPEKSVRASYLKTSPDTGAQQEARCDRLLSFAVCFQISIVGVKNSLVQGIPELYNVNSTLNNVLLVIIALVYIWAFLESWNRIEQINPSVCLFFLFLLLSFFCSYLFFPINRSEIINMLPRVVPYYFLTAYFITKLRTTQWIVYYMTRFCYLNLLACLVTCVFIYIHGHVTTSPWLSYSLPMSYSCMLATIWLLYRFSQRKKLSLLLAAAVGIVIIALFGSRNPLIGITTYIAVKSFKKMFGPDSTIYKKMGFVLLLLFVGLLLLYFRELLTLLNDVLLDLGVQSRTLKLMLESEMNMTGRSEIHSSLLQALSVNPLAGLGVGGDVAVLGISSHGLYLSILAIYGYIIGGLLIAALLYVCAATYFRADEKNREVLLIYYCLILPRGFFGGDVFSSDVFWWMLGLIVVSNCCIRKNRFQPNNALYGA